MADNIYIPNGGLNEKLASVRDNLLKTCDLRLFKNDKLPAATDVASDYLEADFSGYARQSLSDLGGVSNVGGVSQISTGTHTFAHNGGPNQNPIYGWYAVSPTGVLIAVSRNGSAPIVLNGAGQSYSVQATFTDGRA